jgi:hypothetical protein
MGYSELVINKQFNSLLQKSVDVKKLIAELKIKKGGWREKEKGVCLCPGLGKKIEPGVCLGMSCLFCAFAPFPATSWTF